MAVIRRHPMEPKVEPMEEASWEVRSREVKAAQERWAAISPEATKSHAELFRVRTERIHFGRSL